MKAIQLENYGPVTGLNEINTDTPKLLKKQLLVKNHAVAIDPYDVKFIAGKMGTSEELPLIPGSSVVGEVVAIGSDVTDFKVGDRIAATRHQKTYAELVPVGQSVATKVPDSIDDVHAVAAVIGAATGYQMIYRDLNVQPGQKVLIQGGAGAVGSVAVQAALNIGAQVYATAKPADFDYLRSFGDVTPVDYHTAYENELSGFDAVLDTIGGSVSVQSAKILKSGGILRGLAGLDEAALSAFDIDAANTFSDGKRPNLEALFADMVAGKIKLRIGQILPFTLTNLRNVHEQARQHSLQGKTVLTFDTF
ncbi:NADP-dependent oxidoreductase [Weissella paramesenteroides]|jgi:NADPH:quinone reductase-like Zn-dependent oxidoreductase|uniref:NADP-dependent oxidoreductase n=1 Tax=Weissella paramesenteroides TaxID=1249 RepID=A0ABD4XHH5_WEIPA|nr:NADP-dependent oxidoreductase [Weissella paramesenteroides]KAA8439787.1 NADP-dependent oxidoreductase [Weissella paramesenteroides]KAA8441456.1 NADP-dependent oxidoreductase [Weissella paramesenteroides]KAA8444198.1 NADP-dependent oxidoreductase [Weissella paramesenteroides]KAA8445901.1 NADP-dependent oxidoreductase [Weissella paramesenteroides]KAA8448596.1 NADP-dependent oxidoreductase [Weissella paramesenteroides]